MHTASGHEHIIKERRLRWLGHVLRMENSRIPASGNTVGIEGLQVEARTAREKLDRHHQTRSEGYGHWLARSQKLATDRAEWRPTPCSPMQP